MRGSFFLFGPRGVGKSTWLRGLYPQAPRFDLLDEGDFDLDQALRFGTLPVVWAAPDRSEALAAYAQLYLKQEVQTEALVRNLPGFARLLPVAALFHGQLVTWPASRGTPARPAARWRRTSRSWRTRCWPTACPRSR